MNQLMALSKQAMMWSRQLVDWAFSPADGSFEAGSVGRPSRPHTLRVNQLDARRLDTEISSILRQRFVDVFALLSPAALDRIQPELEAALQAVLWRCTIYIDSPTPAGRLQNLVYARADTRGPVPKKLARWQKFSFLALYVVFPWLGLRLKGILDGQEESDSGAIARRWLRSFSHWYFRVVAPRLSSAYAVCAAFNFLLFLRRGIFCTLGDRMLGVRMVHINPMAHRQTEFQYMNRVMMWNGLSDFLMTVLPLINLARIQQSLSRRFFPKAALGQGAQVGNRSCGFCEAFPITLPMLSDCGHTFCYFCIAGEQMANPRKVACPLCSCNIESFKPYSAGG